MAGPSRKELRERLYMDFRRQIAAETMAKYLERGLSQQQAVRMVGNLISHLDLQFSRYPSIGDSYEKCREAWDLLLAATDYNNPRLSEEQRENGLRVARGVLSRKLSRAMPFIGMAVLVLVFVLLMVFNPGH